MRRLTNDRVVDIRQVHFYEQWTNVPALLEYLRAVQPPGMAMQAWETGQPARVLEFGLKLLF